MNASTAKAIKDIIESLRFLYGVDNERAVFTITAARENLEDALHRFAEGVKQDAIEP